MSPNPIESGSKIAQQGGLVFTLSALLVAMIVYIGVDKVAMADRYTATMQRNYAQGTKQDIQAIDTRLRDVEMKHAELKGKLDAIASSIAGLNQGMGELRALLLEHERRDKADAAINGNGSN